MSSSNNPVASRFTRGFLRALTRINRPRQHPSGSASQRRRRVRIAADASLAFAVGPRRAWSRAVLSRTRARGPVTAEAGPIRRRFVKEKKARACCVRELEKVVPGGEGMDVYSLLDETAHYIECLRTQVQVMNTIATLFSDSSTPSSSIKLK